jgi:hypothetical protein
MIVKYLSKFVLEVLPSVVATIIGAYIVNHYITKPAAEVPVAAAVSTVEPKAVDPKKTDAKESETPSDVASAPDSGAAKKSSTDEAAAEKGSVEKGSVDKGLEKSADKPSQTASLPAEMRRHQPAIHDRTIAKTVPVPPPVAATSVVAPVEANPVQEDRRDATEMARAAIERLRGSSAASRAPDAARVQDPPRIASAPVQPLPPPIMVSTPLSGNAYNPNATASLRPPDPRLDDPRRLTPPADIPTASPPMDLHAEATASVPERPTVAQDVLSAARSVFHAVLPR